VIEAIAAGRRAAGAIDASLGGKGFPLEDSRPPLFAINPQAFEESERVRVPQAAPAQRTLLGEDVPTLDFPAISREARRCFDCGCVAVNASDLAPALIALGAVIKTTRRRLSAEKFFDARPLRTTILDRDELVVSVELSVPRTAARQSYLKFRLRNAIDFPIAGLAGLLELKGGRIAQARVVFGAVAPVPLRMTQVERFLIGKTPSEETARAAGKIVLRNVCVLARNGYKAAIVKALLRQWLLFARG
jgi:CO/xanthine dehydrogenase FAD-binding subunit